MWQFGKRAKVLQTALGDATGELKFRINTTNRGKSRLSDTGTISVPQTRGADLFASFGKLDLLKIDVEGFELPIVRSIAKELQRLKPRAILFEDRTGAAAPQDAIGSLLAGYQIFGIDKRLLKTHLRPIHWRDDCQFNDYVALTS